MPPRLPIRASAARRGPRLPSTEGDGQPVCIFCSFSSSSRQASTRQISRKAHGLKRLQSNLASVPAAPAPDARKELEDALVQLQKHAANFVNLSRLQLAINGLRQQPGTESIRIAILGIADGTVSGKSAKQVLKLLLADPLKDQEEWERQVDKHDLTQPMVIRVGAQEQHEAGTISVTRGNLLREVNVSSATLNGNNLELLLAETSLYASSAEEGVAALEDAVLVPTVDIPTSSTGRYTPITTPVHKALLVADGIMGAVSVAALPLVESANVVAAAVNIPEYKSTNVVDLPFTPIDLGTAGLGLDLIRKSLNDAMKYEHMWFDSNLPKLAEWVKADVTSTKGTTKAPVRRLIASLLQNATNAVHLEEARKMASAPTSSAGLEPASHLQSSLASWAETAHTELQEQLDLAFTSRRWRKLSWWKLFWRVDDVHMLTTDIINQRFLPTAEKNAIYLAGRIQEARLPSSIPILYDAPTSEVTNIQQPLTNIWPVNIPATRTYLQNDTIPALQALAQKLVFQTLSTSGLTTSLGALAYFGTLTTGIYEAGAVAALGIVWSMRRMQNRWETARGFWEGEVREEGRKAVRGVEISVDKVIKQSENTRVEDVVENSELTKARLLVEKATEALSRLK